MKGRQMVAMGAATHPGQIRELNEDAIGTPTEMRVPADRRARKGELLAVADGMGGHAAGEVASQQAIRTLFEEYYNDASPDLNASLQRAVEMANSRIYAEASSDLGKHGMGTTLVAAIIQGSRLIVANVGDSRAYLVRGGQIRQISRDHSWVAESVAAGLISEEQARHHTHRNLVLRALGQKPQIEVDIFSQRVRPGDAIVLCSDGLSNEVGDGEIAQVVGRGSAQEGAEDLVGLANGRLGRDNISAVVAKMPPQYGQAVTLPVVLLGIVALTAIVAAAIVLSRPWQHAVSSRETAALTTVEATPTVVVASVTSWTTSPLSSPVPELGPLPTQPPATVPPATPTMLLTQTSAPMLAVTPTPRWPLPTEPACEAAPMEMKLEWGCAFVDRCTTNEDALQGLCDILGYDTDCCEGDDLDPGADLDKGLFVQCRQPRAPRECWQGTVHDYAEQRRGGRSRAWFTLDTEGTDVLRVMVPRGRGPNMQLLDLGRLTEGSRVTVCGTPASPAAVLAQFIVQWMAGDSCRLWLAPPPTQDGFWLAGNGKEIQDLFRLPPPALGEARVLVYSQWEPEGRDHACNLRPIMFVDEELAIFTHRKVGSGCVYTSERGQ